MRRLLSSVLAASTLLLPFTAHGRWQVKSEFQLHLTEPLFDKLVEDFWQSLQGEKTIPVGNVSMSLNSETRLQLNNINVNVNYSFPLPKRVDPVRRVWELRSDALGARVSLDQLLVTQRKTVMIGGIPFITEVTVECRNIAVNLPTGAASIQARVSAEVAQNQIHLEMPQYSAHWPENAWQVESLDCPALAGLQGLIKEQIVNYLSSFDNLDQDVNDALVAQFKKWSQEASVLLLSELELPSKSEYLKIYYEPKTAVENNGRGLILGGTIRFDYPYVAPDQDFLQEFTLPEGTAVANQANPQLVIPFAAIRAMMMGQYFAGNLEYTMKSTDIPAFTELMNSRFKQFFGWPDLQTYPKNSLFLFNVQPLGPPSFENVSAGGAGTINGNLTLPMSLRMYAPKEGKYVPYVEFRTRVIGPASMNLLKDGKINFKLTASEQPATYAFAQDYVNKYKPNTKIAIDTISKAMRTSLNADGIDLQIPTFAVGNQLSLVPEKWNFQGSQVLRLDFTAKQLLKATSVGSKK